MVKAILFDLDDTLLDWGHFAANWEEIEAKHLPPVFEYLTTLGEVQGDLNLFLAHFRERTRHVWLDARTTLIAPHVGKVLVQTATMLGIPEDQIDQRTCMEVYGWGKVEGTSIFPDVIDGLTLLRERGVKFGMVTNAFQPMWMRDVELEQHGLLDFFPACRFSAADVGHLKPHPEIFRRALDCLGTRPEETVFVGDNPVADIAGAQAAGMRAVIRVESLGSFHSTTDHRHGFAVRIASSTSGENSSLSPSAMPRRANSPARVSSTNWMSLPLAESAR